MVIEKHQLRWYGHVKKKRKITKKGNMEVKKTTKKLDAVCNERHEFGQYH